MTDRPTTRNPAAGAAAATIVTMLIGAGLAGCGDTADTATSPSTDPPVSTAAESAVPSRSAVQVARAYWEAIAASDPIAAVALIDPGTNELSVKPAGRGRTLAELMEWYDANGWEWEVGDCIVVEDGAVDCDLVVRSDWSDALEMAPLAVTVGAAVSDAGVTRLIERSDECCPGIDEFHRWVAEMYPDDAAAMWNGPEMNPEIMGLFKVNTARFVDAHQSE